MQYEACIYEDLDLKLPIITHNTKDNSGYFSYDQTGTGKHFIPYPPEGINFPTNGTLVRYSINKNRLKALFVSKRSSIYQFQMDARNITKKYSLNSINTSNISINDVNRDVFVLGDNKTIYRIPNADFKTTCSIRSSNQTVFTKIDSARNLIWQIENERIVLKNYSGNSLLNIYLPHAISSVLNCRINRNTGELFILAKSDYSTYGTEIISYLKNRNSKSFYSPIGDLVVIDQYATDIGLWRLNGVLIVNEDGFIKSMTNGIISNLYDLSSYGIAPSSIESKFNDTIYVFDKSSLILSKIDPNHGTLMWELEVNSVAETEKLKMNANFDGKCVWLTERAIHLIIDEDSRGVIENEYSIHSPGEAFATIEELVNIPHAWLKSQRYYGVG